MRPTLLFSAALLVCSSLFATPGSVSVYFDTDQFVLKPEFRQQLLEFAGQIDPTENFSVVIKGYADYRGSEAHNQVLAMRRASAVKAFLEDQGLHPFELRVISSGEAESAQAGSENQVQRDRRVDIDLQLLSFNSVEELHEALSVGNEFQTLIDASEGGTIRSAKGTTLHIPANSMIDANGEVYSGEALLSITEALSPLEYFTEGLTTKSGDAILETDGMIRVVATDVNGDELCVSSDAELTVLVPSDKIDPRMELFVSETGDDWDATGQANQLRDIPYEAPPVFKYGRNFNMKFHEDKSTFPVQPSEPISPRKPKEPVESNFQPNLKWYEFLWKKKKQKIAQRQYQHAVDRYDKRNEKYQERLHKYQIDVETLDARMERYEQRVEQWEIDQECKKEAWTKEIYEPAKEKYDVFFDAAYAKYQVKYKAWKDARVALAEDRLNKLADLGEMNVQDISGYVFKLNSFGWINCDYFWQDNERAKQAIVLNNEFDEKVPVVVAYTNAKSIIRPDFQGSGTYQLNNVPFGEPATVIAYKVEDGKVLLCSQPLNHNGDNDLKYEEVNLRQLRAAISNVMGV